MAEKDPNTQSDFMIEKIKERPLSRRKLVRHMLLTVTMAILFGLVACFTFLALEPVLSNWMNPKEELPHIYFPEEEEEMAPEDMLAENIPSSSQEGSGEEAGLEPDQIKEILSDVRLDLADYRQLYAALAEYSEVLEKSMVTVTGISSSVDWLNDINESTNRAAGVIIANNTRELLILTSYTPLSKAELLKVTFSNGAETTAELKQKDPSTKLAVITVALEGLPKDFLESISIAVPGSTNYRKLEGTPVIALGIPMGTPNSVGYGMITSSSGQAQVADASLKLLQTDICGSQKASGVLFNLQGQMIGIITTEHNSSDMSNQIVAYGISDLKKRMEKLSNDQPFAYLGIYGVSVSVTAHEGLGVPYGAYINKVDMNSPAMRVGIRQGDIIVGIDEKEIKDMNDFIYGLSIAKPDQSVKITIMRQAQNEYKEMILDLVYGELK